jgi:hypothetical protein
MKNQNMRATLWGIALAVFVGCAEDAEPGADAVDVDTLCAQETLCPPEETLAQCVDGRPCVWLAPGSGDDMSAAYTNGTAVGVFDGLQGVVATWFTVVIAEGPAEGSPKISIRLDGEDVDVDLALTIPLKAGGGFRFNKGLMVAFGIPCCAADYDGRPVTVSLDVAFDGLPVASNTFQATLTQVGTPQ